MTSGPFFFILVKSIGRKKGPILFRLEAERKIYKYKPDE
jgi:hypothetical protein